MTAPVAAVALLRNLNHGQRGSPTGDQLVAAFVEAGADDVRTVGANGTVLFTAAEPTRCTGTAVGLLVASSPWDDIGFALTLEALAAALPPLAEPGLESRTEFSAFGPGPLPDAPVAGRRCVVTVVGDGWALTVDEREGESRATPTLERVLGRPVTSRAVGTMRRTLAR